MLNRAELIGNLGGKPEIKYTNDGRAVCNFSMATTEIFTSGEDREKKEFTEWHRIVAFGRLGEICSEYLDKGSRIYLEGRIQTREYTGEHGERRWSTSIVANNMKMLDRKNRRYEGAPVDDYEPAPKGRSAPADDIPF